MRFILSEKVKTALTNIWFLWALCLILNIITFLFIYYKIHPGDKILALHYNVLAGVEWYGTGKNLYFIPEVGLSITGINFILYRALKNNGAFFSFLAIFTSLCVQLVLFFSILFLARVN